MVSAIKAAEAGGGWLVRGVNLSDKEIEVRIRPWRPFRQAWRASLAEENQSPLAMAQDGSISFTAREHEIVTVRLNEG